MYVYPWDLVAEGHDAAMARIAAMGIRAVNLACAYHAGKFLLPHNPHHRVYFAEDGALYFRAEPERYGRLRPRISSLVADSGDPLVDADRARRRHGLDVVAWVVCLHNSWLGERYPECTVRNAFGDPYPHSLSPAHPDVRAYLVGLVTDIARRVDVTAMELEAPDYLPVEHGFHHEIFGVPLSDAQRVLLGLSFGSADLAAAARAGVDGETVQRRVADALRGGWDEPPPTDSTLRDPDVQAYIAMCEEVVASLVAELREAIHAVNPRIEIRILVPPEIRTNVGLRTDQVAGLADSVITGYAASDAEAFERAVAVRRLLGSKPVYGLIRAIAPDTTSAEALGSRARAWLAGGATGLNIYNYGLMSAAMLGALGAALSQAVTVTEMRADA
ncbi:MAG: hypothetical protein QOF11_1069 [Chloroflexota bacterium]|jgi:hypothetical protein|nr:hypothetical protein [Chloroflexota bacterium]